MRDTRTVTVLRDAAGQPRALSQPRYRLRVLRGPDKRQQTVASRERVRIGSGAGADFVLTDQTVSALHCELLADEGGFRIRDLGAKNGVRIGGRRIVEAWLNPKEDLELGDSVVRFTLLDEDEEHPLPPLPSFGGLVGSSVRMREVYAQLELAARGEATVLLQGESGTGKEIAAAALVSQGPRKDRPLVVVDCGALSPTLAESELFGHEKGAFTGAAASFAGAFERANGGTLFLDEIGELPRELQPKLLGALERRVVQRLGGSAPIPIDVRIIAATHVELERAVNKGSFRADLFYRLAVVEIRLPPLREHREDLPELVANFLQAMPGPPTLPAAVLRRLYEAEYPGNVRELRNAVERAVAGVEPVRGAPAASLAGPAAIDLAVPYRQQKDALIDRFDRDYLAQLLEACGGNVSEAARRSGLSRVHLTTLVQRHRLGGR